MAVYNVEPFIREAIDSVIAQDIGFQNIQLILVNDGSKDASGTICDEYAAKYPGNILVIHKENGGVSSARNAGLDCVSGEYVNFMDPDDKLKKNALSAAYRLFRESGDQTDVVCFPVHFFEARVGEHHLNYKFQQGTRVIDLQTEWDNPLVSSSAAMVRTASIGTLRFDTQLKVGEDLHLMQKILLKKNTLGVVQNTAYLYRIRSSGQDSALQRSQNNADRYLS